ncbi:MAG: EamA family transporter [Cryomorphaceae bacterium]|nr:EamA family transporter [Cryomorphaceae bacterium]
MEENSVVGEKAEVQTADPKENLKRWALFIFLALAWGSSFLLMKRGLRSFDYAQIGSLRIGFAWLLATFIALRQFKNLRKKDIWPLLLVGIFGNGLPYFLFPLAITKLDSGLVGVLNSTVPLFTLLTGALIFGVAFKSKQLIGVLVGLSGAIILLQPQPGGDWGTNILYASLPLIASVCYALSVNIIGKYLKHLRSIAITSLSLLFVGPVCIMWLFSSTNFTVIMQTDVLAWENLGLVAVLGMVNSALAIIIFNQLIKNSSPLFASSVTYLIPIVALLWGLYDGENLGWLHISGMAVILLGVYLVNVKRPVRT